MVASIDQPADLGSSPGAASTSRRAISIGCPARSIAASALRRPIGIGRPAANGPSRRRRAKASAAVHAASRPRPRAGAASSGVDPGGAQRHRRPAARHSRGGRARRRAPRRTRDRRHSRARRSARRSPRPAAPPSPSQPRSPSLRADRRRSLRAGGGVAADIVRARAARAPPRRAAGRRGVAGICMRVGTCAMFVPQSGRI